MIDLDIWRNDRINPRSLMTTWDSMAWEFDSFFNEFDTTIGGQRRPERDRLAVPACDIQEGAKSYVMSFDMPGIKKEDVAIEVVGNTLTVTGKRQREEKIEDAHFHRIERQFGEFKRIFTLPDKVRLDSIEAQYENGVLYLVLPKEEVSKSKKIEIGEAKPGFLKRLVGVRTEEAEKKATVN